jgi:epoxyqueuosine reductase
MTYKTHLQVPSLLLEKAKEFGAHLAGFAAVKHLMDSPSFIFAPQMPGAGEGVGTRENKLGLKPGEVLWPENAKTVMVVAVQHPEEKPEMDWWFGRVDPPGNRILANVVKSLCEYIPGNFDINVVHLPYHVEKGGTYLKDAAVLSGLGCIGRNNILITPEYGPRVRLRALTLDVEFPTTGPLNYDPCSVCEGWCRKACPQHAFDKEICSSNTYHLQLLPGRDGNFSRPMCNLKMDKDNSVAQEQEVDGFDNPIKVIKYCRRCELACPIGKPFS